MTASDLNTVGVICCLSAFLFVQLPFSRHGWTRDLAVAVLFLLTCLYAWRRFAVLPAFDASVASYWQWSFGVTEGLALLYECWSYFVLRRMSDHSREADLAEAAFHQLPTPPRVALFIPTYHESVAMLEKILNAAVELARAYPGQLTVYCLDDGRYPKTPGGEPPREPEEADRLRDHCRKIGVTYWARKIKGWDKAGNLQFAFRKTTEEFIVAIDCDFHVDVRRFLPRTIGLLLQNPRLGLVQVPQCFINPDPVGHNLRAPAAIADAQTSFMSVIQACRDYFGNAFCVGSGWVARRSALDAIDGFGRLRTVGEDLEITYRLKLAGYQTRFLNEVLSYGLAPESLLEYVGQQARWCLGCFQQLLLPSGPIRGRHRLVDRVFYLDPALFWLTHFATIQLLLAPIMFWWFGIESIPDPDNQVLAAIVPRLATRALLLFWLTRGISLPLIAGLPKMLAAFHIVLAIFKWAFVTAHVPMRVTGKCDVRTHVVVRWPLFIVFASLTTLILLGLFLGELDGLPGGSLGEPSPLNYAWSISAALMTFLAALVCIELPTPVIDSVSEHTVQQGSVRGSLAGVVRRVVSWR